MVNQTQPSNSNSKCRPVTDYRFDFQARDSRMENNEKPNDLTPTDLGNESNEKELNFLDVSFSDDDEDYDNDETIYESSTDDEETDEDHTETNPESSQGNQENEVNPGEEAEESKEGLDNVIRDESGLPLFYCKRKKKHVSMSKYQHRLENRAAYIMQDCLDLQEQMVAFLNRDLIEEVEEINKLLDETMDICQDIYGQWSEHFSQDPFQISEAEEARTMATESGDNRIS